MDVVLKLGMRSADAVLDYAPAALAGLAVTRTVREPLRASAAMVSHLAAMDDRVEGKRTGILTGFTDIDDLLNGGPNEGALVILSARPSMTAGDTSSVTTTVSLSVAKVTGADSTQGTKHVTRTTRKDAASAQESSCRANSTVAARTESGVASDKSSAARKRGVPPDLTENAAATTIQSRGPYIASAPIRESGAAAGSFASSYIGNVTISTEAVSATDYCDAILSYIDVMAEAATATDTVDAGVATTTSVVEGILAQALANSAKYSPTDVTVAAASDISDKALDLAPDQDEFSTTTDAQGANSDAKK